MGTWSHSDPYGIWTRSQDAVDRGLANEWASGDVFTRGAELRALIIRTGLAGTRLTFRGVALSPSTTFVQLGDISPASYPSADHLRASRAMFGWVEAIGGGKRAISDAFTTVGESGGGEVAGWPIVLAIVAGAGVWALAACYIAERYESTLDRFAARVDNTNRLMGATSTATNIVEAHNAREVAAGQTLPWSEQENKVLDAALAAQKLFSEKPDPPQDKHPSLGSGLFSFGSGGLVAALAIGYFLWKDRS